MEKKFKCKDEILLKNKEAESAMWFYAIFSNYCKNNTFITISGGITYDLDFFDILPYEGNEHLVGTTHSPDDEVKLEEGEWIIGIGQYDVESFLNNRKYGCIGNFKGLERFGDGSCFKFEGGMTTYAVKFSDFNPNDMEETKKHILCVKNGKIVRYKG